MSQTELEQKRIKQRRAFELLMWKIGTLECAVGQTVTMKLDQEKILETCAELPAAYDKEVTEKICQHFDLHPSGSNGFKQTIKEIRAEMNPTKAKKVRPPEAKREDYFELIRATLGEVKKDIFSGKLMYFDEELDIWNSVWNHKLTIKATAKDIEQEGIHSFTLGLIEPYISSLEHQTQGKIIAVENLPEWDGLDRLKIMSDCLVLAGDQIGFTPELVEDIVKDWITKAWQRFYKPEIRNRILILRGGQHVGKDWWIDTMCDGLGQWSQNLTITRNEKDNLLQLASAGFLKISEFDRTSATDTGLLKHMITAPNGDLRGAYAHDARRYNFKCSFVSSCNIEDIYRDSTGHSRYIVFNINKIVWDYPREKSDRLQILAQAKQLAIHNYRASKKHEELLAAFLESKKPTTIEDEILESFNNYFVDWWEHSHEHYIKRKIIERGWMTNPELMEADILSKVAKDCGTNVRVVQKKLKLKGLGKKNDKVTGYKIDVPLDDGERDTHVLQVSREETSIKTQLELERDTSLVYGDDDDIPF